MTGRIIYRPAARNACTGPTGCPDKPAFDGLDRGTIWQCDECDQQWVLVIGAQYNETYWAWRKLTPTTAGGYDR